MGISGVKNAVERDCSFIPSLGVTMSKPAVHVSVVERINIKVLAQEGVKFRRLIKQFSKNHFKSSSVCAVQAIREGS